MELLTLDLPFPPSVNHYWLQKGAKRFLSERALTYRREVWHLFAESKHKGFGCKQRLHMAVLIYPPDKRRRDLDNCLKAIQDSLQHACVFEDDNQIDALTITRMPMYTGRATVTITCL